MKGTDPAVRKKAALCFLRFFRENPENLIHIEWVEKMVSLFFSTSFRFIVSFVPFHRFLCSVSSCSLFRFGAPCAVSLTCARCHCSLSLSNVLCCVWCPFSVPLFHACVLRSLLLLYVPFQYSVLPVSVLCNNFFSFLPHLV